MIEFYKKKYQLDFRLLLFYQVIGHSLPGQKYIKETSVLYESF